MLSEIVFWTASALLAWVYLGYPVLVAVVGWLAPWRSEPSNPPPTLTIAIAVHNEAATMAERVANVLDPRVQAGARIAEVIIGCDGSSDGTDRIAARLAVAEPRLHVLVLPRRGQTATQHTMIEGATGDVVILSDAETRFEPGCLARLADAFRDPRVGAATGRLEWRNEAATATSSNEGLYWRYERRIRELESRAGFLTAVTGALLAVRRSSYRSVPPTASMDHLLPLYVREEGGEVVYVPGAVATDRPISGLREQFRNRSRTASRGIRANLSMAGRLAPWGHAQAALSIWSHKLLRWATPWLIVAVLGAGLIVASRGSQAATIAVAVIATGVLAAAAGQLLASSGRRPPRPLAFARAFAIVNLAFARAWLDVFTGRRIEAWKGVEWEQPS